MKIHLAGDIAYLWGDWTAAEMTYGTIDTLTGLLDQIQANGRKKLEIDCAHLNSIDVSGAKYFYIWLNCLNLRGITYELKNMAGKQEETFLYSGITGQAIYHNPFERKYLTSHKKKGRKADESRRDQGYRQAEAG